MEIFTRINEFLDQETSITVLRVLVLLAVLAWLLTGGFRLPGFRRGKRRKDDDER